MTLQANDMTRFCFISFNEYLPILNAKRTQRKWFFIRIICPDDTARTMVFQIKAYHIHNIMTVFMLRDFCILLLFLVVFINITLLPNETSKPSSISSIYSSSTIVYAQQQQRQQPVLSATNNQEWIDKQSNTKVQFTYSPEKPLVSGFTELKFNIKDSKRGTQLRDVFARVTIIGVLPQKNSSQIL